jgi:hypothetical protein
MDDVAKVAPGIDSPVHTGLPQGAQKVEQLRHNGGALEVIDERAIEVRGEQFDHGAGGGSGID